MSPEDRAKEIEAALDAKARKDAEEKEREEQAKRADADAGEKLDRILECLDSLSSRMDAYDARRDAEERELKEEGEPKELKADSRSDSLYEQHLSRRDSYEVRNELSEIQSAAEVSCSAWGQEARRPMQNELPHEYRRRVAQPLKQYSKTWQNVNFRELNGQALKVATDQIFADSYAAATNNDTFAGNGYLREVRRVDPDTGARIKEFYGDPRRGCQLFLAAAER